MRGRDKRLTQDSRAYFLAAESRGSWGSGSFSHDGSTPHRSVAYSAIVRSEENLPPEAMFIRHLRAHSSGSCGECQQRKNSKRRAE